MHSCRPVATGFANSYAHRSRFPGTPSEQSSRPSTHISPGESSGRRMSAIRPFLFSTHIRKEEHRKMAGKLANRCRRSLLATLAVGIVGVGGCLGATSASAAAVTGTGLTGTTAATPTGIAAVAQQQENVIAPAYYVTP